MVKIHLPIGLLIDDHEKCVVVGGGKVGTRKVLTLLEMGCKNIHVIAPELSESLQSCVESKQINVHPHLFEETDAKNARIVFACTSSDANNAHIVATAKRHGALTLRTDNAWLEGDFVSMATIKHENLLLAVSTTGRSCRKSRHIKDFLAQQITHLSNIQPFIFGIDQRTMQLNDRESLMINAQKEQKIAGYISQLRSIHSFMILNTCNRIEVIGIGNMNEITCELLRQLFGFKENYCVRGNDAIEHFALTMSGLYAQVPAEKHITSQIKSAFSIAKTNHWANKTLEEWLNITLHLSRKIRNTIEPHFKTIEVEDLIARMATQNHPKGIMIIGAGVLGSAVKQSLARLKIPLYWVYHTKKPHLSEKDPIHLLKIDEIHKFLPDVEYIIGATKTDHPLLSSATAGIQTKSLFIDLGLPRNFDTNLKEHYKLMDLDDIRHWYRKHLSQIDALIPMAKQEIENEKSYYQKWSQSLSKEAACTLL